MFRTKKLHLTNETIKAMNVPAIPSDNDNVSESFSYSSSNESLVGVKQKLKHKNENSKIQSPKTSLSNKSLLPQSPNHKNKYTKNLSPKPCTSTSILKSTKKGIYNYLKL